MTMDRLKQLPEVTDHVLSGLKADDALKQRILLSAAEGQHNRTYSFRTVVALCSISVLLILLCIFVTRIPVNNVSTSEIQVIPAGGRRIVSPVNLQQVIDQVSGTGQETQTEENGVE